MSHLESHNIINIDDTYLFQTSKNDYNLYNVKSVIFLFLV